MNETYLDKAVQNYNAAASLYSSLACSDEMYLGIVGYHLQQSAELAMKYILDENGVDYPKTHDLNQLMIMADRNGVDLHITDYIYQNAALLTNWETNTRYVLNYMLEANRVKDALNGVKEYIQNIAAAEHRVPNHEDKDSTQGTDSGRD